MAIDTSSYIDSEADGYKLTVETFIDYDIYVKYLLLEYQIIILIEI